MDAGIRKLEPTEEEFAESCQIWPQFNDAQGFREKIASYYGIGGIPAIFILDRKNRFVGKDDPFKDREEQIQFTLEAKQ